MIICKFASSSPKPTTFLTLFFSSFRLHSGQDIIPGNHSGGYRSSRTSITSQPVVRVVAKSKQTDPVMSSSLQNIPNGLSGGGVGSGGGSLHQNNSKSPKNHHQIYDTKPTSNMNQSTPSLNRDVSLSPREMSINREGIYNITTSAGSINPSPNHRETFHRVSPSHQNNYINRDRVGGGGGGVGVGVGGVGGVGLHSGNSVTRSDGIYGQNQRINLPYSSDTNLVHPRDNILNDRINSTSSSNESVCSSSSRDLNHSMRYTNFPSNNFAIRDDVTSQIFSPKKIQRGKNVERIKNHLSRDNM